MPATFPCALNEVHRSTDTPSPIFPALDDHRLMGAVRDGDVARVRALLDDGVLDRMQGRHRAQASGLNGEQRPEQDPQVLLAWLASGCGEWSFTGLLQTVFAQPDRTMLDLVLDRIGVPDALPWVGQRATLDRLRERGRVLTVQEQYEQLTGSALNGRLDLVTYWLDEGLDPNVPDEQGRGLLHRLMDQGPGPRKDLDVPTTLVVLDLVLDRGGSLETRDRDGFTVLLRALRPVDDPHRAFPDQRAHDSDPHQPAWALVHGLLERGANADAVGPRGSALLMALGHGGWASGVVSALRERGARLAVPVFPATGPSLERPPVASAWTRAVRSLNANLVDLCLELGEPVNGTLPATLDDRDRVRWGRVAMDQGEMPLVRTVVPPDPLRPLVLAASGGFPYAVDRLIDAGADLQAAIDDPHWGPLGEVASASHLCAEIPLPTDRDPMVVGRRLLERAALRQAVNQAIGPDQDDTAGEPAPAPRPRARL